MEKNISPGLRRRGVSKQNLWGSNECLRAVTPSNWVSNGGRKKVLGSQGACQDQGEEKEKGERVLGTGRAKMRSRRIGLEGNRHKEIK